MLWSLQKQELVVVGVQEDRAAAPVRLASLHPPVTRHSRMLQMTSEYWKWRLQQQEQKVGQWFQTSINLSMLYGIRRNRLNTGSSQSVSVPIYREGDNTDCDHYWGIITVINYKISSNNLLSTLTSYTYEIIGIIRVDSEVIDQMRRHSACAKYLR